MPYKLLMLSSRATSMAPHVHLTGKMGHLEIHHCHATYANLLVYMTTYKRNDIASIFVVLQNLFNVRIVLFKNQVGAEVFYLRG